MSPPIPSDLGARVPATTEIEDAAPGGSGGAVTNPPPAPTCPVCMEPWTCNGDHRICCIPCGHVYGRSCLERWLHRCGDRCAKCPQCGEQFEHKHITNLYAPGNLWDGCCRLQELKAHYEAEIHETERRSETMIAEYMEKTLSDIEKLRSELVGRCARMSAELKEQKSKEIAEYQDTTSLEIQSLRDEALQMVDQIVRMWNEEKAMAKANLKTMKERMKKMAEEENATATELIEFVERTFPPSSVISYPCDFASVSAPAPAPVDSENTSWRLNRPYQLLPVPTPPCPAADAASKRQGRGT